MMKEENQDVKEMKIRRKVDDVKEMERKYKGINVRKDQIVKHTKKMGERR